MYRNVYTGCLKSSVITVFPDETVITLEGVILGQNQSHHQRLITSFVAKSKQDRLQIVSRQEKLKHFSVNELDKICVFFERPRHE